MNFFGGNFVNKGTGDLWLACSLLERIVCFFSLLELLELLNIFVVIHLGAGVVALLG